MLIIAIYLIYGLIWGYVCRAVVRNKGYYDDWFLWGFIFGIFAFLVAISKPAIQQIQPMYPVQPSIAPQSTNSTNLNLLNNDRRVCPKCKKTNEKYITSCSCGEEKPSMSAYEKYKQAEREKTMWTCYKCGKKNPQGIYICSCGNKKSNNIENAQSETDVQKIAENAQSENAVQKITENDKIVQLDILKKYKELLDVGAITQEEFDRKKAEIL